MVILSQFQNAPVTNDIQNERLKDKCSVNQEQMIYNEKWINRIKYY